MTFFFFNCDFWVSRDSRMIKSCKDFFRDGRKRNTREHAYG
jgi:hypothetical protein